MRTSLFPGCGILVLGNPKFQIIANAYVTTPKYFSEMHSKFTFGVREVIVMSSRSR